MKTIIYLMLVFFISSCKSSGQFELKKVEFTDHKALGHDLIFEIKYTFKDFGLVKITCDDHKAESVLTAEKIFPNTEFRASDFYCFPFHNLVEDLSDYTDDYKMPSFTEGDGPKAVFKFSDDDLFLDIEINEESIKIYSIKDGSVINTFYRN